jgi:hypothetical protein
MGKGFLKPSENTVSAAAHFLFLPRQSPAISVVSTLNLAISAYVGKENIRPISG